MASKYLPPKELEKRINEYFENTPNGMFPDEPGMLLELDLFEEDVAYLCEDDPKAAEYQRIFKRARLRRESWLNRMAVTDSRNSSMYINLLKQEKNGGYTSTSSAQSKGGEFKIVWGNGIDGPDAFK